MVAKKIGRPTDSLKDKMLRIRVDDSVIEKLDALVRLEKSNRSAVIRNAIEREYDQKAK